MEWEEWTRLCNRVGVGPITGKVIVLLAYAAAAVLLVWLLAPGGSS